MRSLAYLSLLALVTCSQPQPRAGPGSAASPEAPPAPRRPIAVMLEEDPPLPGAEARWDLWPGLERDLPPPAGQGAHGPAPGPAPAEQRDAGRPEQEHHHGH